MDDQSDVDLVLAVVPTSIDDVMGNRVAIASRLGLLLAAFTGEHVGEPRLLVCLFDSPLLHVDLKFVSSDDLVRRVEDPVILWERDGALTSAFSSSRAEWPPVDPQWVEDRFWVWVHYIAAKMIRGELFEALNSLAYLRAQVLAPLAAATEGKPARGVRHVERDLTSHVEGLRRTVATYDQDSCGAALRAAIAQYRALRALAASSGFVFRSEAEHAATRYLDDTLARSVR